MLVGVIEGNSISAASSTTSVSVYNACSPVDLPVAQLDCLYIPSLRRDAIDSLYSRVLKFTNGYGRGPVSEERWEF
jgi:hypothetical protein